MNRCAFVMRDKYVTNTCILSIQNVEMEMVRIRTRLQQHTAKDRQWQEYAKCEFLDSPLIK